MADDSNSQPSGQTPAGSLIPWASIGTAILSAGAGYASSAAGPYIGIAVVGLIVAGAWALQHYWGALMRQQLNDQAAGKIGTDAVNDAQEVDDTRNVIDHFIDRPERAEDDPEVKGP